MKLTKATENGYNLWVVEHKVPDGAVIRLMLKANATTVDIANPQGRQRVAGGLWKIRSDLRRLADLPPPA